METKKVALGIVGITIFLFGCVSSTRSDPGTSSCEMHLLGNGTSVRGDAYKRLASVNTASDCCAACEADRGCMAWVLESQPVEDGLPRCLLKSIIGEPYTCNQCYGAALRLSSPPSMAPTPAWPPTPPHVPAAPTPPPFAAPRPHVFVVIQDDLGHDDVAFNGNDVNLDVTGNITRLAAEGIILGRHYVHWHCSPTRRTFLTGRLPLHHSEMLSGVATDDIDLRWTTIGQKLKSVGYKTYWFGKGHTGYLSVNHLPLQIGFDMFTGFLGGAEDHFSINRFQGNFPYSDPSYSADLYGRRALETVNVYNSSSADAAPLFFYLPWQNVHEPYQAPKTWPSDQDVLRGMLHASDQWMGLLRTSLHDKGMWNTTVLFYSADNGGVNRGSNWPLRGEKHTNWEGGMRAAAFVSGGFIPPKLRGTRNKMVFHIADWYTTICHLAGVSGVDDPPVAPLPVDPSNPQKDIYGTNSFPAVDGVNIWPMLTEPTLYDSSNITAAHTQLWLSAQVLLRGRYKIVVAQQEPSITNNPPVYGWKCGGSDHARCDTSNSSSEQWVDPTPAQSACGCAFKDRSHLVPCLFDVVDDPSEYHDLSLQNESLRADMWRALNLSNLEWYGPGHSPVDKLGPCDANCSAAFWAPWAPRHDGQNYPICGVPGCN
eukprot:m.336074 g.336074  ORF g.336074 m.336074 type:complete len:653 (-) comp20530_c0_seq11:146-2104(-)